MKLVVIGASGHLGGEVARRASGFEVVPVSRATGVDVRDQLALHVLFQQVRPAAVINSAYDRGSWAVMADGAANVAAAAAAVGARLVHVSSDAVHSGRPQWYAESDEPDPITPYGAAKAAAETAVAAIDPSAAIVRTSLILGDETTGHVRFALDLANGAPGQLFTDEIRCPVDGGDLASAILELVGNDYAGIINIAGPDAVNRVVLGRLIAAHYGLAPQFKTCTIAESGMTRPGEVKIDSSRARRILRTRLRGAVELFSDAP
jgi:dTDP-4-dehydrorhamnose reductase